MIDGSPAAGVGNSLGSSTRSSNPIRPFPPLQHHQEDVKVDGREAGDAGGLPDTGGADSAELLAALHRIATIVDVERLVLWAFVWLVP